MARSALSYCLGRWLGTYKTKLVHCYVDQFFHAGTTTTSRLEGAHHVLKQWIGKPTKDMTGVWESVQLAINHQLDEIRTYRGQCYSGTIVRTQNEFFSDLSQEITPQGQMKLHSQWTLYKSEETRLRNCETSSICTGTFFSSMGVPCWHMIKARLAVNCDGKAGTGKTHTILQTCGYLDRLAEQQGLPSPVLRAAPTGVAAFNFFG
jgi:hypothetical protein